MGKGLTALVFGGSGGLGYPTARGLVGNGYDTVILVARTELKLRSAADRLARDTGANVLHVAGDATRPDTYARIARLVEEKGNGMLNAVVHAAGDFETLAPMTYARRDPAHDPEFDAHIARLHGDAQRIIDSKVLPHAMQHLTLQQMQIRGAQHTMQPSLEIIYCSVANLSTFPGNSPYGAANAAQEFQAFQSFFAGGGSVLPVTVFPELTATPGVQDKLPGVTLRLDPTYVGHITANLAARRQATHIYFRRIQEPGRAEPVDTFRAFSFPFSQYLPGADFDRGLGARMLNDYAARRYRHFHDLLEHP